MSCPDCEETVKRSRFSRANTLLRKNRALREKLQELGDMADSWLESANDPCAPPEVRRLVRAMAEGVRSILDREGSKG